jgi:hypothetical protein
MGTSVESLQPTARNSGADGPERVPSGMSMPRPRLSDRQRDGGVAATTDKFPGVSDGVVTRDCMWYADSKGWHGGRHDRIPCTPKEQKGPAGAAIVAGVTRTSQQAASAFSWTT